MPNKHVIFLVHGMGINGTNWSDAVQKTLTDLYAAYPALSFVPFDQQFQFIAVTYDDEFEALRKQWRDSSTALGSALSGAKLDVGSVSTLDKLASSTNKDSFINTHVVDVILYRFTGLTTATIRESVRNQILTALTKLDQTQPMRWSVIAHSLGTSVIHDTLHETYTDPSTSAKANLAGVTRPILLAMIANVSRVLETDIDVYLSRVRPGSPDDPLAVCKYFLNARHHWDPIPQPKAFRPAQQWPSFGIRALTPRRFLNVEISEIEQLNVHDFNHYLRNPLVHGPLFNCLVDREALSAEAIDTAHKQFAAHTPLDEFGNLVQKLKQFQLGEEDEWKDILVSWRQFLSSVQKLLPNQN
jgi:hypothetical protein